MKVLVSDKISEESLGLFNNSGIEYDYIPEITPEELKNHIGRYVALIVRSRTKVNAEIIDYAKDLKIIGRVGSGVDNIDVKKAQDKKITVVNSPDANSIAVAENTIGLAISLLRKYPAAFTSMKDGLWLKKELSGFEISGKIVGIIGYGHIAKRVESIFTAFGAKCLIFSRRYKTADLDRIFSVSDIVTIHVPLTEETKGLVSEKYLSQMKRTSYLINTSRGEVIREKALMDKLKKGGIAGVAMDVFWKEPLPSDSPWRNMENVILTPHISASTKEATARGSVTVISDVINILNGGKPVNPVNISE